MPQGSNSRAAAKQRQEEDRQKALAEVAASSKAKEDVRRVAEAAENDLHLTPLDRQHVQVALAVLGFDTGSTDGVLVSSTRKQIAAWQKFRGYPETGFLTDEQKIKLLNSVNVPTAIWAFDKQIDEARQQSAEAAARQKANEKQARRKAEAEQAASRTVFYPDQIRAELLSGIGATRSSTGMATVSVNLPSALMPSIVSISYIVNSRPYFGNPPNFTAEIPLDSKLCQLGDVTVVAYLRNSGGNPFAGTVQTSWPASASDTCKAIAR